MKQNLFFEAINLYNAMCIFTPKTNDFEVKKMFVDDVFR